MRKPSRPAHRKYLDPDERSRALDAAYSAPPGHRSLLLILIYTGCKVSEAIALTSNDIDLPGDAIMIHGSEGDCRAIPVPPSVLLQIDTIHGIRFLQASTDPRRAFPLWPVNRTTAWRWIAAIMKTANISGPPASPRGLRHGFAVQAVHDGASPAAVQAWMGYSTREMTEIYALANKT